MRYRIIITAAEEVKAASANEAVDMVIANLDDQNVMVQEWNIDKKEWEVV